MPLPATYKIRNQWSWSMVGGNGSAASGTGTASEIEIDGLERDVDDERRPGAAGSIHYGGDFEPMTATITLTSMTDSLRLAAFESVCNNNVSITLSAVMENIRDTCDIATYSAMMRGIIIKYPIGWSLSNETAENELVLGINYFTDTWKSKAFIYDPDNMIWSWNGVNLWQARKEALGI